MVRHTATTAAIAAIAIAATSHNNAYAFQPSRPVALSPLVKQQVPLATSAPSSSSFRTAADITSNQRRNTPTHAMTTGQRSHASQSLRNRSLFGTTSQKTRRALQRLRRSVTLLLASFAIFLSSTRIMHAPPAHAASTAAAASTTTSTLSLTQKLNPFRTRSADEMIEAYVRDKLFADDEYDPVESAYREAFADYADSGGGQGALTSSGKDGGGSATSLGAYPTLLAETAGAALGESKSVSAVLSSATARSVGAATAGAKKDGITAVLIKASDFLQSKLRVSASMSYYIIAGGGFFGIATVPGLIGVLYQGIQRAQIDRGEMKTYGKVSDMDATSKEEGDDDDDDEEE